MCNKVSSFAFGLKFNFKPKLAFLALIYVQGKQPTVVYFG
jgi:hypothetical protein